jgi:hypothetical protein
MIVNMILIIMIVATAAAAAIIADMVMGQGSHRHTDAVPNVVQIQVVHYSERPGYRGQAACTTFSMIMQTNAAICLQGFAEQK